MTREPKLIIISKSLIRERKPLVVEMQAIEINRRSVDVMDHR